MHGRSWRPLLEGKAAEWRRAYFYCYFYERNFNTPTVTAVRTETAKLIKYPGHDEWTEMFDLAADPYELKNLYADPAKAALRRELGAEYDKQAAAIAFRVPEFADKPGEPGEPKAKAKGKAKKG
jgi:arylsulfatase A-like enzyme